MIDPENQQSLSSLASAIQTNQVSSREVVESYLRQIRRVNPKLNAVVRLSAESALAQATRADQALTKGTLLGPLHGIPMTIKDSFDTAGIVSTGGTLGRSDFIPTRDATVVSRLRAAGAILLGKTNTSEFTLSYDADNLLYGRTSNPYDLQRSSGGSSGGAAAIVAAGGSPFDIGSDYGGSLRYPAHCCGVCTIKPTSGRVPRTGHILPFGGMLDSFQQVGPIARRVEDLQLLLPLICGPDNIDPSIVPMPLAEPGSIELGSLRVSYHTDNGILPASPETREVVRRAAAILEQERLVVEEARPAGLEQSYELGLGLWSADGGAMIERLLTEHGTEEHTIPWLGLAKPLDAGQLDALLVRWYQYRSSMLSIFQDYDLILCPVNAHPALAHGAIGADLRAFSYTSAYNLTGWPAVVLRGGTSATGLPIGLQIVAAPWREDLALALAAFLEQALGTFPQPGCSEPIS
ncbi:amidase [Desulfogranum mediterraneum]|uniref:amidase n=1 Tax=Desulfogranum mediterraneum TaxID=160661 RepID=UPI000406C8D4|nr:amidase family protein [Desulfogranum mediterraneum]